MGVKEWEDSEDFYFEPGLNYRNEELQKLNKEAHKLEKKINENVSKLLSNEKHK